MCSGGIILKEVVQEKGWKCTGAAAVGTRDMTAAAGAVEDQCTAAAVEGRGTAAAVRGGRNDDAAAHVGVENDSGEMVKGVEIWRGIGMEW